MSRLVDTGMAAAAVGRSPVTIRRWVQRGWVQRQGREGRRGLVDLGHVYDVDQRLRTRDTPGRPR